MNPDHLQPFVQATCETFSIMMKQQVFPGPPVADGGAFSFPMAAIIKLRGGALGAVAMAFPEATAMAVAQAFAGERDHNHKSIKDAVSEIVNVVAGAAKRHLPVRNVSISLPGWADAKAIQSGAKLTGATRVPFQSSLGRFELLVLIEVTS